MTHPDPRWSAPLKPGPPPAAAAEPVPEPAVRREVDRADYDPDYDPEAPVWCEMCGFQMHYTAACKLQCGNCGYKRDCSDP